MKILFLTDDFYPHLGANSLIVKALSEELTYNGNDVYVMPFSGSKELSETEEWNGIHIIRTIGSDGKTELKNLLKKLHFISAAKILINRVLKKMGRNSIRSKEIISARYEVERVIKEKQIDLVVSVHCSIECSFPVYYLKKKNKLPFKWLFYMLDPFATHSYYTENFKQKDLKVTQHKLLSACDKILCSDIIAQEIGQIESEDIVKKIEVAEYPKIEDIRSKAKQVALDERYIHCACVGTFNQAVRPADYLFGVIDRLKDTNLLFHFFGAGWDENNEFSVTDRTNCIFHGRVCWEEAISFECSCDYLINIGNKVKNQFPSKVLEYVCTGKPIIDFSKYQYGLTQKCLTAYPSSLIVCEEKNIDDAVQRIRQFTSSKHAEIDYPQVRELFAKATPTYVAEQIVNNI